MDTMDVGRFVGDGRLMGLGDAFGRGGRDWRYGLTRTDMDSHGRRGCAFFSASDRRP